jgi:hypothetical protein
LRRVLPPVLSAVLALAVAVPVTWYLATVDASGVDPGPDLVRAGPGGRDELREQLLAQLPDREVDGAVLLEVPNDAEAATGVPPGRYRVDLICGLLRRQGAAPEEVPFLLGTQDQSWRVVVPGPSTPLTMAEELDFTGVPAGAVSVMPELVGARPLAYLLLLQLVPVTGGPGG